MSDYSGAPAPVPAPPAARRISRIDTVHGERRVDDYFWLRGKDDPEVIAYLRAENAHTDAVMKPSAALADTLYAEMLARIKEDDQTVPYRRGDYFYYSRTEQGKQYPILCRKLGSVDAPEEVTLDLNALAAGHPFFALGMAVVSDDGHLLAYTTDLTGFRQYTLSVKDLRTGSLLPDRIEKVVSIAWAADDRTLFYVTEDAAKRPYRLYRHVLGAAADDLVYEETDALFNLGVERTRSRRYLLATSASFTTTEVRYTTPPRRRRRGRSSCPGSRITNTTSTTGWARARTSASTSAPMAAAGGTFASSPRPWRIRALRTGSSSSRTATT